MADEAGGWYSYGAGVKTYAEFIRTTKVEHDRKRVVIAGEPYYYTLSLYQAWLEGYFSAINQIRQQQGSKAKQITIVSNDGLLWIRSYCEQNLLDNFYEAALSLVEELTTKKQTR